MKPLTDIQLYDFLKDNHESILNDMIQMDTNRESLPADILKEIANTTVKTINSRLLDSSRFFESHLKEWADIVMKRSLQLNISVSYLADLLTHDRRIYCQYIEQFIPSQGNELTLGITCHWFSLINEGFDRLLSHFIHRMDTYKNRQFSEQQRLINELSTAVIPLINQIGVLPLTGQMDSERFEFVLKAVPNQCIHLEVNHLFIDMSGIPVIDVLISEQLSRLTKMLKLLGISATISGMKPEVALYTIQSGINLSHFSTSSTLKQALRNYGVKIAP